MALAQDRGSGATWLTPMDIFIPECVSQGSQIISIAKDE